MDHVADRPINHQIVIPLSDQTSLREGGAEMQYWLSQNPKSQSNLVAQACLGLGVLKDMEFDNSSLNAVDLKSIPLDLFKITL